MGHGRATRAAERAVAPPGVGGDDVGKREKNNREMRVARSVPLKLSTLPD